MIYTDACQVVPVTYDAQFGNATEGTAVIYKCRVERIDPVKAQQYGDFKAFDRLYILPPDAVVKNGDKIKTLTIAGVTDTDDYALIGSVFPVARRSLHHYEVLTVRGGISV